VTLPAVINALLDQARRYARDGDARAEKAFALVLENDAFNVEARTFLARSAMQAGRPQEAFGHLDIAARVSPDNAALWRSLGLAHIALGQWPEAQAALERCLQLAPKMHAARLHLGKVLETCGEHSAAMKTYLRALSEAQREGLWLDDATTPPWLAADVRHAVEIANLGRQELYGALMEPLLARFGADDLRRVDRCVKGILGFEQLNAPNAKQRPTFMYFPSLPDTPVFDRRLFPWFERLESHAAAIKAEAGQVLNAARGLDPFLSLGEKDRVGDYLGGAKPNWDACFFYRHGEKFPENHAASPITATVLESLPLVRITDHAPEICFSVLGAGTHILPHYGTTNTRSVVHLPLIVPDGCALKVLDQVVVGREGECLAFDDTYLHEAWNRGTDTRVILLMDTWNPHLSEVEKLALAEVVSLTGTFNRL
jgi:aspartate beta-hydroxylase